MGIPRYSMRAHESETGLGSQGGPASGALMSGSRNGRIKVSELFATIAVLIGALAVAWVILEPPWRRPQAPRLVGRARAPSWPEGPAVVPPQPPPTDLTMFRGNPERNLSAVGSVPRRPKLLWRFQTKTKAEGPYEQRGDKTLTPATPWRGMGWTGQPVRLRDRVYLGSSDSNVYCLDASTGQALWFYETHHVVKGSISIFGDRIYHGGRDNKIHCYDLNGRMVWETRTGNDMDSNPVVVGERGYMGGEDNHIYCFNAVTGQIVWRSETTEGSVESSPCVFGDRVVAGSDRGVLYGCDLKTGKTVWKFDAQGDTDSTAVHWKGRLYVGSKTGKTAEKGHLWCLEAGTGKPVWHVPMARGIWATVALNPTKDRLYVGCNNGVFYALRMTDGGLVWKRNLGSRIWSSAAVADGCVVVGVRDGRLWCLDEDTGAPVWMFDDGFDIDATPCVAGGMIVIGSQNGWIYAIGEAAPEEAINPHWFVTRFPPRGRTDHNPYGIVTVQSPAPPPGTYNDTSAHCTANLFKPVYGPGFAPHRIGGAPAAPGPN